METHGYAVVGAGPMGLACVRALTRAGLPFPELEEAVFSLKEGANSAPVKSPLGWHLFHVTDVEPGSTKTLDEVRDDLGQSLALEKAVDNMFELANRLDS